MLTLKFVLLVISVFVGYVVGYYGAEVYSISQYKLFDFKAFRCRPCLSFHASWVTSTIISLMFGDWIMVGVGIAFALMLWLGLKIDEKNKTITLEEYDKKYGKS